MAAITDLHDLCEDFLLACAAALDTIPDADPSLDGAPDRQFVAPGQPVVDFGADDCCSQLAVWPVAIAEKSTTPGGLDAGRRAQRDAWVNDVLLLAQINRCIPTGSTSSLGTYKPPTAAELTASAAQLNADAWALWHYLHAAVQAELLLTLCDNVVLEGIASMAPSGGCAGWLVTVRVALGGYTATIGS